MAAHHDDAACLAFLRDHLFPGEQRLVGNIADGLDQCGRTADGEVTALCHGAVQCHCKHLHIAVRHCVHDHMAVIVHRQQLGLDAVKVHGAQAFQRDAGHVSCTDFAAGFFLNVFAQVAGVVAKGLVLGKFGLAAGHKLCAVAHIMHVVQCKASALAEVGAQDVAIHFVTVLSLRHLAQQVGLQRVVAAQGGVAAADDQVVHAELAGHLGGVLRDLAVGLGGLGHGKAAAVGQNKEELFRRSKALAQAFYRPICININIMYRLYAGRVVVQHNDLAVAGGSFGGKGGVQFFLIHLWKAGQNIGTADLFHLKLLLYSYSTCAISTSGSSPRQAIWWVSPGMAAMMSPFSKICSSPLMMWTARPETMTMLSISCSCVCLPMVTPGASVWRT